jgi:hypothetical protein
MKRKGGLTEAQRAILAEATRMVADIGRAAEAAPDAAPVAGVEEEEDTPVVAEPDGEGEAEEVELGTVFGSDSAAAAGSAAMCLAFTVAMAADGVNLYDLLDDERFRAMPQ